MCGLRLTPHATGNEIHTPPDTSHDWLSLRRLGGQLAGRVDPEPALLPGDGRARSHSVTSPSIIRLRCAAMPQIANGGGAIHVIR